MLFLLSPFAIGLYLWLFTKRIPLLRLAGITSLISAICIAILHFSDAAIDNASRHFQISGVLLTACLATRTAVKGWQGKIARLVIVGSVLVGSWTIARRSVFFQSFTSPTIQHLRIQESGGVVEILKKISAEPGDKLIAITEPIHAVYLHFTSHSSTRFFYITDATRSLHEPYKGRIPRIIIPHSKERFEENKQTRAYFVDYSEDDWETYMVDDWIFSEARTVNSIDHQSGD